MKALFNKKSNTQLLNIKNIELNYFKSIDDAKGYLGTLDNQEWEIIRFTPSQHYNDIMKNILIFLIKHLIKLLGKNLKM